MNKYTLDEFLLRGPITPISTPKAAGSDKKTYYVLTYRGCITDAKYYLTCRADGKSGYGESSLAKATKYSTIQEVIQIPYLQLWRGENGFSVVRVEETPAASEVRLVSKTKIDATKPVVIFGVESGNYGVIESGRGVKYLTTGRKAGLSEAKVFSDLNAALGEIVDTGRTSGMKFSDMKYDRSHLHIHQVEIVPGTPTVTETVLA